MTDLLENVGLMVALMVSGIGITYCVLIMFVKAIDYLEGRND